MKIRDKLILWFSLIISLVLILFGYTIIYFSTEYRKSEFFNRLKQRIEVTEKIFLEKANFSPSDYNKIQREFLNKLPYETEEVILEDSVSHAGTLRYTYPEGFMKDLLSKKEAYYQEDQVQGAGKIFQIDNQKYLVLLTAVDDLGIRMMDYLTTIIIVALVICILVIMMVSYLVSTALINPISRQIKKANSISGSNLHERLIIYNSDDEIGELSASLNHLLDRVAEAFKTQKLFIDNASHEIRNPLTAIMGQTEYTLGKLRSTEEYVEALKSISTEAERLNILVNNLLQLSNMAKDKIKFNDELIDVKMLLAKAKDKFDFLYPQNKVKLNFNSTDPQRSGPMIRGDWTLLETAFINLLDNASKFSFYKEVNVSLISKNSQWIIISIRDQGVGIPEEDIKNINQPFHRGSNVRQIKGTGIGIPLTIKIVALHQGNLQFLSKVDVGTEVTVTLPLYTTT